MEIERETLVQIAVSVIGVGFLVAAVVAVGVTYGEEGVIGEEGGAALVGAIAAFILLMTAIGYWLSGREN